MVVEFMTTVQGRRIAVQQGSGRAGPGVVFLGGYRSDMTGTKATCLADWAEARGQSFLRLDYSGHGQSPGEVQDGSIGDWFEDAASVIAARTSGPQVLVGSSMGGWIALLLARACPERVAGLVGIAAAPDFTEDLIWAGLSAQNRLTVTTTGRLERPSVYSGAPFVITWRLIEEGRRRLVLRAPLDLAFPVRLLHGTADKDVPQAVALRLLAHATCPDMRLMLVKAADHRFSTPDCLGLMLGAVEEVLARI